MFFAIKTKFLLQKGTQQELRTTTEKHLCRAGFDSTIAPQSTKPNKKHQSSILAQHRLPP
jgi:hypothetical protein